MASESTYYVPEQSKLPILLGLSLGLFAFGAGHWVRVGNPLVFWVSILAIVAVLTVWFSTVIEENMRGLPNAQVKRSYVWGMGWFIFSEVMFFAAFFGALFYLRNLAVPWLAGEGHGAANAEYLWPGFEANWPLMITPEQAVSGDAARVVGPEQHMSWPGFSGLLHWLPLWNTIILMTSSVTVHFAHHALKHDDRKKFNLFLGITVALGLIFMCVQFYEYYEAYAHMGLTLDSGVYGTTFFMLTGFHGAHVTMGTIFLAIQLFRSFKGHFRKDDHFGFEAASWYWHFVDVVWVMLFFFVYIF